MQTDYSDAPDKPLPSCGIPYHLDYTSSADAGGDCGGVARSAQVLRALPHARQGAAQEAEAEAEAGVVLLNRELGAEPQARESRRPPRPERASRARAVAAVASPAAQARAAGRVERDHYTQGGVPTDARPP